MFDLIGYQYEKTYLDNILRLDELAIEMLESLRLPYFLS